LGENAEPMRQGSNKVVFADLVDRFCGPKMLVLSSDIRIRSELRTLGILLSFLSLLQTGYRKEIRKERISCGKYTIWLFLKFATGQYYYSAQLGSVFMAPVTHFKTKV
jgi:hypothetical protein